MARFMFAHKVVWILCSLIITEVQTLHKSGVPHLIRLDISSSDIKYFDESLQMRLIDRISAIGFRSCTLVYSINQPLLVLYLMI